MKRSPLYLTFLLSVLSLDASATVYVAAVDPETKAIGLAYSSSGGNFWQYRVKDRGLIGAGARGLCDEATPEVFLKQGLSAEQVARELERQCTRAGWHDYRLAIATTDGSLETFIARRGCTVENPECGELKSSDMVIVGGGLEKDVLETGQRVFADLPRTWSLECRLLKTLQAIYRVGGEKKDFVGASVTVDYPSSPQLLHVEARGRESELLPELNRQLKCSSFPFRKPPKRKSLSSSPRRGRAGEDGTPSDPRRDRY